MIANLIDEVFGGGVKSKLCILIICLLTCVVEPDDGCIKKYYEGVYFYQAYIGVTEEMEEEGSSTTSIWNNYVFRPFLIVKNGSVINPYSLEKMDTGQFYKLIENKKMFVTDMKKIYGTLSGLKCFDSLEYFKSEDVPDYEKCTGVFRGDTSYVERIQSKYLIEIDDRAYHPHSPLMLTTTDAFEKKDNKQKVVDTSQYIETYWEITNTIDFDFLWKNGICDSNCEIRNKAVKQLYSFHLKNKVAYAGIMHLTIIKQGEIFVKNVFFVKTKKELEILHVYGNSEDPEISLNENAQIATIADLNGDKNEEIAVYVAYTKHNKTAHLKDPNRFKGRFRTDLWEWCNSGWKKTFVSNIR